MAEITPSLIERETGKKTQEPVSTASPGIRLWALRTCRGRFGRCALLVTHSCVGPGTERTHLNPWISVNTCPGSVNICPGSGLNWHVPFPHALRLVPAIPSRCSCQRRFACGSCTRPPSAARCWRCPPPGGSSGGSTGAWRLTPTARRARSRSRGSSRCGVGWVVDDTTKCCCYVLW